MNRRLRTRIDALLIGTMLACVGVGLVALAPDRPAHVRPRCAAGQTAVDYAAGDGSTTLRCLREDQGRVDRNRGRR